MLLSALLLYLISRLYAIKMVDRIDEDDQTEKLFVNNASHEINNPLTAIQGECDIALMRERSASGYHGSLERIDKEVEHVIRIMKQLLQFSYARREKINEENLDNIQIGTILATFGEATTKLAIIEDFSIIAKEDLLLIALHNLINNARKYSNGKDITITVDRPYIRIEDQGIGIPQTDLKHIFEPFYRATNTTSISGHGIGLALAKQILEKCDAKISVTSIEGQGTRFQIRFKKTITAIHKVQKITKVW
jgi:signal transduction histidine kinase